MEISVVGHLVSNDVIIPISGTSLMSVYKALPHPVDDVVVTKITKYSLTDILVGNAYSPKARMDSRYAVVDACGHEVGSFSSMLMAVACLTEVVASDAYKTYPAKKRPVAVWAYKWYGHDAYLKWLQASQRQNAHNTAHKDVYLFSLKLKMQVLAESDPCLCTWVEAQKAMRALDNLLAKGRQLGKVNEPVPVFINGFSGRLK